DLEGDDAKAVLWAHNEHVGRSSMHYEAINVTLMGLRLHELFGPKQIVVGFAFNQGSFKAGSVPGGVWMDHSVPPTPAGSYEAPLAEVGLPLYALDLRDAPSEGPLADWLMSPPRRSFGAGYSPEFEVRREATLDAVMRRRRDKFDVVIFVDSTTPAHPYPSASAAQKAAPITNPEPVNLRLSEGDRIPTGWRVPAEDDPYPHTVALSLEASPARGRTVSISRPAAPWPWGGDGALAQTFAAGQRRGRRLRFSASIKAQAGELGAGARIYIRVASKSAGRALDVMADRPVRSAQWGRYAAEVDVPADAETIEIGLLFTGNGAA